MLESFMQRKVIRGVLACRPLGKVLEELGKFNNVERKLERKGCMKSGKGLATS
jgi:hypothetical protein